MKGFPPTAFWKILEPDECRVTEPTNSTFVNPRAPTVVEEEAIFIPVKYNFSKHHIEIPEFEGKVDIVKMVKGGRKGRRDRPAMKKDGTPETIAVKQNRLKIKKRMKEKYKLSAFSHPHEFVEVFCPFNDHTVKGKSMFSFSKLCSWTNLKATLANAGPGGSCYIDYKPFTTNEIRQHLGLYILQGFAPSPRIEMKLYPQRVDKFNGNDFMYRSFGENAERRFRHFKAFFACQDPAIDPPSRKTFPNWKVRPMIEWMNIIGPKIVKLGCCISIDEMTMRFKGRHKDKRRITYKAEGDGFQADALCQEGYTYQVFMRNDPAPKKYLKQGLSPLHSRVMSLFDSLTENHHQCAMDNLYNSASFC